ncbi:hypothetical protein AB4254_08020 [Vibrio breoganii]
MGVVYEDQIFSSFSAVVVVGLNNSVALLALNEETKSGDQGYSVAIDIDVCGVYDWFQYLSLSDIERGTYLIEGSASFYCGIAEYKEITVKEVAKEGALSDGS